MWKREQDPVSDPQLDPTLAQTGLPEGEVYLDDDFNALRFEGFDPQEAMRSIHPVLDTARAQGRHIWGSSEHHQGYALGIWTAAARRTMAETLLVGVEEDVHYRGSYPTQIAELSKSFFLDAEKWHTFAAEAGADPMYRVGSGADLTPEAAWPLSPATRIAPQLMGGLQRILGIGGTESTLLTQLYPHVQTEANGDHLSHFFSEYKGRVDQEQTALQTRLAIINQRWRPGLDPNTEPGRTLYMDMVRCAEAYVALGSHMLMPATLDPRLRLAEPTIEKVETVDLPAFDSTDLLGGGPAEPQLQAFDVADFATPATTALTEERTPQLPAFDASQIVGDKALTEEQRDAPALPTFNASELFGATATSGAGIVIENPDETLPVFDINDL